MKVNYQYSKKDIKKYLFKNRLINNLILLILGVIIYICLTYKNISLIYLPLFILGLALILFIINIIYIEVYLKVMNNINYEMYGKYELELKGGQFILKVNNTSTSYKYNNIKKLKIKKNYFIVKLKNSREYLTFEKKLFSEENYNKVLDIFKSKINY